MSRRLARVVECHQCGRKFHPFSSSSMKYCTLQCYFQARKVGAHPPPNRKRPSREELVRSYTMEQKSQYEIAELYEVSQNSVSRWLRFYDIKTRKPEETLKIKLKRLGLTARKVKNRHAKAVMEETRTLESQGFRCIPVEQQLGVPVPDIVAIKDGKVYAVEVTHEERPSYWKYNTFKEIYDDVIWIKRRPSWRDGSYKRSKISGSVGVS